MIKAKLTFSLVCLAILSMLLNACGSSTPEISDVWGRPGLAGENSAAYFTIKNNSISKDRLLSASADIAEAVEIHISMISGEGEQQQMQMVPQESVDVPGLKKVEFKPGGLHVMFVNLKQNLAPGDSYSLTLHFEKAGDIQIDVPVREP